MTSASGRITGTLDCTLLTAIQEVRYPYTHFTDGKAAVQRFFPPENFEIWQSISRSRIENQPSPAQPQSHASSPENLLLKPDRAQIPSKAGLTCRREWRAPAAWARWAAPARWPGAAVPLSSPARRDPGTHGGEEAPAAGRPWAGRRTPATVGAGLPHLGGILQGEPAGEAVQGIHEGGRAAEGGGVLRGRRCPGLRRGLPRALGEAPARAAGQPRPRARMPPLGTRRRGGGRTCGHGAVAAQAAVLSEAGSR